MIRYLAILFTAGVLLAGAERAAAQPKFLQRTAADWANQLKSPDAAARRNAAFALGKMGTFAGQAFPALNQATRQEKDVRAHESMICAAGEIALAQRLAQEEGTPVVADAEWEALLIEAIRHPDKLVRRSAACSLGMLAGKTDATRTALTNALTDAEQIVRQNAAWALGQLDDKAAPSLVSVLADATSDRLVKRDAANALFAVGRAKPEAMRPALNHLLEMCGHADPEVRKAGLAPLAKIVTEKDTHALKVLKNVLGDQDPEIKRYAAVALSNVGGDAAREAVPILVDALRHGDLQLKRSAAISLHNVGAAAAAAVPHLVKALEDADPELRKNAALALGGIGEGADAAVPALVKLLVDTAQPVDVRIEAAEAMTGMGKNAAVRDRIPDMLGVLGNAKEDGNLRVRLAWMFNPFLQHEKTMTAAKPVMDSVCTERDNKENGSTRYHCAYLLGIKFGPAAPESALNVLGEWLFDSTGKLYGPKRVGVDSGGLEKKGKENVQLVLEGDSRIMAVDALRIIGRDRVRARKDITAQLGALVKDSTTHKELRAEANKLLNLLAP